MRKVILASLLAVAFAVSGCASFVTPVGNSVDIDDVDMTTSFKTGESCAWMILNLLGPFGDMSVVKASQDAGIRKVDVVDYHITNYIIAQNVCAHVYGQ